MLMPMKDSKRTDNKSISSHCFHSVPLPNREHVHATANQHLSTRCRTANRQRSNCQSLGTDAAIERIVRAANRRVPAAMSGIVSCRTLSKVVVRVRGGRSHQEAPGRGLQDKSADLRRVHVIVSVRVFRRPPIAPAGASRQFPREIKPRSAVPCRSREGTPSLSAATTMFWARSVRRSRRQAPKSLRRRGRRAGKRRLGSRADKNFRRTRRGNSPVDILAAAGAPNSPFPPACRRAGRRDPRRPERAFRRSVGVHGRCRRALC